MTLLTFRSSVLLMFRTGPGFGNSIIPCFQMKISVVSYPTVFPIYRSVSAFSSIKAWWDFLKSSLKADVIFYAPSKKKKLNHEWVSLTNSLISLKRRLMQGENSVGS